VKICSLYGAGFYYIPGTDTCLKIGGWVRFETGWGYNGSFTTQFYNGNLQNRFTNDNNWRVKGVISFDAREQTEYGTLRSYATIGTSNNNIGDNPTAANYVNRWFIQFAGFTIGHATSFYDFYSIGANQYGNATGSSDTGDGGWDVFGYTAQFGNGFSASVAAEVQRRTRIVNMNAALAILPSNTVGGNYQGHDYPDVTANLRVDQAWGSAQIMGALHVVGASYYGATEFTGHPDNELGFALGAGIKLNAPMIGRGDYFQAEVDYTKGASRYTNHTATTWDYSMWSGTILGFGINSDAVYGGATGAGTASNLELTETWAVNAAYTHFWTPAWKSTLWGSYMAVRYNDRANAMMCGAVGAGTTAVAAVGCDMDWNLWGLGLRTEWAATKNLSIGLEVLYANLDTATLGPGGAFAQATKGVSTGFDDQDIWAVRFRVNRNFYP
jgi:hypothetical protein